MLRTHFRSICSAALVLLISCSAGARFAHAADQPDIVLIMADDLGYSDIGCYGSEIETPNLDRLASAATLFTNFSNTSRCCPSRASLLTGLYSHRAGIGDMNNADKGPGYRGQLLAEVNTLPELLKEEGYTTAMVGKWHLTRSSSINQGPNGSWPLQRGFDRFYGTMEGAKNYFKPTWLFDQTQEIKSFGEDYFYTNAISQRATEWIHNQPQEKPLFLYAAFYAPHFPLQAPQQIIDRHRGKYLDGWDALRARRFAKQQQLGLLPDDVQLSPRPSEVPAWDTLSPQQQQHLDTRMAVYAAQVELLDQGIGRILDALEQSGRAENALVVFLSDNGGASTGGPFGAGPQKTVGQPDNPIKSTYGKGWATLSNTPFRMHKANTHEGGVMSPLIVRWPSSMRTAQRHRHDAVHIIDMVPTLVAAAGSDMNANSFDGIDFKAQRRHASDALGYEHQKSRALRVGDWKLVNRDKSPDWELYRLSTDRTELHDLAESHPEQLNQLVKRWHAWAKELHVKVK